MAAGLPLLIRTSRRARCVQNPYQNNAVLLASSQCKVGRDSDVCAPQALLTKKCWSMRRDKRELASKTTLRGLLDDSQAVVELPSDLSITAVDVAAHETVASLAEGQGELTGLALLLLAEQHKVQPHNTPLIPHIPP